MKRSLERELHEVGLLVALSVAVPLVWVGLGWDPSLSLGGLDTLESFTPFTAELVRAGGDWRAVAYRADISGGAVLVPILCAFPITRLLAAAGAPVHLVVAGTFFVLQLIAGYLGMKTVTDLSSLWREIHPPPERDLHDAPNDVAVANDLGARLLVGLAFAFAPVLGWRVAAGQPGFIAGTYVFSGALMLAVAVLARRLTWTAVACVVIGLMHAFQSMSTQIAIDGIVFGGPLIAGGILSWWSPLWAAPGGKRRLVAACVVPIVVGVCGLLFSWDVFDAIHRSATSSDFARQYEKSAIYTLVVAQPRDWLASIPWSEIAPREGPAFLRHETNYPFGPALLLLPLVPWRRGGMRFATCVLAPLAISAIAVVCLACNIEPISGAILRVLPVLARFRVPARAAIPLCLMVLTLGLAGVLSAARLRFTRKVGAVALVSFVALFVAPTWAFEVAIAGAALAMVLSRRLTLFSDLQAWLNPASVVVLMTAGSLAAFHQRQAEYVSAATMMNDSPAIHSMIRDDFPESESSLRRAAIEFATSAGLNTGLSVGISSLNGYANPTARFVLLRGAIENKPPDYMRVFNHIPPETPDFRVWRALYNVTHILRREGSAIHVAPTGQPDRPAWFSAKLVRLDDEKSLATALLDADLPEALLASGWFVRSDALTAGVEKEPAGAPEVCAKAKVLHVDARGQRFRVAVESPARCVLTLSTNFTELFRVRIETRDGWAEGTAFPIYGALTGVLVPSGATEVEVEAIVEKRSSPWGMPLFGVMLLAALLTLTAPWRKNGTPDR